MSDEISQYEIENAMEKIQGYWMPRIGELRQDTFIRSKEQYIKALKRYIEAAEHITEAAYNKNYK